MMKMFSLVLLAALPSTLWAAYPIDVTEKLGDTQISFDAQEITHDMSGLILRNHGTVPVRCQAVFRNGPEAPRVRKVLIEPHSQNTLTAKFTREILRLRIALTCENEG